tara:strand:+ start:728 stop:2392 length:1665 start_codon:yes stop_codon:yes gene_type:complete
MAKLSINLGTNPNDGTGDNLRGGGTKINANFTEIYSNLGDGTNIINNIKIADTSSTVSTIALGETFKVIGGTGVNAVISGDTLTLTTDNTIMTGSGTVTMTNKSMALGTNTLTGTTAEFNTALTDDDFATLTNSVALTNKDLTSATNSFRPITIADTSSTTSTIGLGETLKIVGSGGATSTVSGDTVTIAVANLSNANLSGSAAISNANLANPSITFGSTAAALGSTVSSFDGVNFTGAGTFDLTASGSKARFNFAGTGNFPSETTYEGMFAYDTTGDKPYVADAAGWINILTENDGIERHPNVNISGIANGNALIWSSSNGRFEPGSAGGYVAGTDLDLAGANAQDAGYISHRSPDSTVTKTLTITVATKTSEHYEFGSGSNNGYVIDGDQSPHLTLSKGVYKFDQAAGTNATHPLKFYYDRDKNREMSTGVVVTGTAGNAGANTTITIDENTPTPLFYECTAHSYMGHSIDIVGGKQARLNITTDKSNVGNSAGANSGKSFTVIANRTVDDVLVFVNGICLVPTDDYTISGTTLTFIQAPANGAEIVFRYLG